MLQLLEKIVIILVVLALIFAVAVLLTAWWWGVFTPVEVLSFERGPCFMVTVLEPDSPAHLPSQIEAVRSYLVKKGQQPLLPLGAFYHDPLSPDKVLRAAEASGGWLVRDSVSVDSAYILLRTARQMVVTAAVKINPIIARYKLYPVLKSWLERQGYQPASDQLVLEIYHTPDSMEVQIPITKMDYDSYPPR
jgi:hypothetical protein